MSTDDVLEILAFIFLFFVLFAWFASLFRRIAWRLGRGRRGHHRRNHNYPPPRDAWPPKPIEPSRTYDAADQLRVVMNADFSARPLLNSSEARVFQELCQIVSRIRPGWRVMAQVSLGEILRSPNSEAFSCINSKRVDMLLIDEECRPQHAIEYQGGGHYQGTAAARDAVKKEALRRAGIGYHEVVAGKTTPADLRQFIEALLARTDAPGR